MDSDPFLGSISMFGGNFAVRGWALCDGQLLAISQNEALFSLLGTTYGGDGRTSFALPDLRGRVAVHPGAGPGLTPRQLGQRGGQETVTLTTAQMPQHSHGFFAGAGQGSAGTNAPGNYLGASAGTDTIYTGAAPTSASQMGTSVGNTGGSQWHTNIQPFECVNFEIAMVGIYPSRN